MATVKSYANYTAIQLATDVAFIAWVKFPDKGSDLFWKNYLNKYPSQLDVVRKAKAIVNEMHIVRESMNEATAGDVWERIYNNISQEPSEKSFTKAVSMRRWWMAAAILLLAATGGYFFWKKDSTAEIVNKANKPKPLPNDKAPGGNKAILTLANGAKVVLDSARNGTISKQGDVTIIKLDGKLAYQKSAADHALTEVIYNTITTPKGGQYQLVLADGSKVWLNSASSLRFPTLFAGNERKVVLTGEGYFEVAHNEAMPFIVEKGETKVQVLGTHFNINAYDDEADIRVTLLEGSVNVISDNSNRILKPGQQAQITNAINVISDVNIDKVMAWKNGWFEFDETDLSAIMRQVGRWYDVDIIYEGKLSNEKFGGRISRNLPMSAILQMLESNGVSGFRLDGKHLIVLP